MAELGRTQQRFPSRQYRYPYAVPSDLLMDEPAAPGAVFRFIAGRDAFPVSLSKDEIRAGLQDPFARLILHGDDTPPLSLRALLAKLDTSSMTNQRVFVVADGGQVPWSPETETLQRNFRLAIARQSVTDPQPDLLISASTDIDSPTNFLQVIGWDAGAGAYQFYERRNGNWISAGSSWDALAPGSRGAGPFDSHINGALNMKELKFPWLHWHSPSAAISDEVLSPGDPLRRESLWTGRSLADEFERTVVRPGIDRWSESRFSRRTANGKLTRLPEFFRQVLGTSTVNLTSSPTSSAAMAAGGDVKLPATFLIDVDALLGTIGLDAEIPPLIVKSSVYQACLTQFDVRVSDGQHTFSGDTHFVFVVPEPAFEDVLVLQKLIALGILSERLAAALLMVDFTNPVFSPRRAALMHFVPDEAPLSDAAGFADAFVDAVRAAPAAALPGRPEHEFLSNWSLPEAEWRREYERRIEAFVEAVLPGLASAAAFSKIFELAESRRREFRRRPLAEFRLTTPVTNIPDSAPLLEMDAGGTIRPKSEAHMALTRFDAPGFLTDWNDQAAKRMEQMGKRSPRRGTRCRWRGDRQLRPTAAVLQHASHTARAGRRHQGHRLAGISAGGAGQFHHRQAALADGRQQPRHSGRVLRVERHARSADRSHHPRHVHQRGTGILAVPGGGGAGAGAGAVPAAHQP